MADNQNKNQSDEFFRLITQEENKTSSQVIENPFADDEIFFKDADGQIRILKNDDVKEWTDSEAGEAGGERGESIIFKQGAVDLDKLVATPQPINLDQEVEKVLQSSQLSFDTPEENQRFKKIVLARLKEIRTQADTRELLLRLTSDGGIGLDDQTAQKVLDIISLKLEQLDKKHRDNVSQEPFAELQAEAQQLLKQSQASLVPPKPPTLVFTQAPSTEELTQDLEDSSFEKTSEPKIPTPPPVAKPVAELPDTLTNSESPVTEKPKIQDVKFKPRLTGPVEEIRSLTIVDFRRLASDPQKAIARIIEKIEILEDESFLQKIEAVKAWKQSEIYQLYLSVGQQSMDNKMPVTEVIASRQQGSEPALSEKEFEAISDLNQKLRY